MIWAIPMHRSATIFSTEMRKGRMICPAEKIPAKMLCKRITTTKYSEIYSRRGTPDGDVETLAVVAGTEQYNIPAVLCRKKEVKQWLFGREAVKFAEEGECFLIKTLVSM